MKIDSKEWAGSSKNFYNNGQTGSPLNEDGFETERNVLGALKEMNQLS